MDFHDCQDSLIQQHWEAINSENQSIFDTVMTKT